MRSRIIASVLGLVALSAAASAEPPRRLYSRGSSTFIWAEPRKSEKDQLGYVRVGESVKLRETSPRSGPGCARGYYAVEPRGYVCLDDSATLDRNDPYFVAVQNARLRAAPLPLHYALSNGAPMYRRLPSSAEWEKEERWFGPPGKLQPLSWGNRGHAELAETRAIRATDPLPEFLKNGGAAAGSTGLVRRQIPNGSMLSYTRAFEHEGRTFLLSTDLTVVPADRVRPYRESTFAGVRLGNGVDLPLAWTRVRARPKWRRANDGSFVATGSEWPVRTAIALEADAVSGFFPTRERDATGAQLFIAESDATLVRKRELLWGASETDKWIVVSITNGTLVAYEGRRPVFATLVSPGAGGVPIPGKDPVKMSTTPLGIYRINYKHRAATMSPEKGENRTFWIADVPYTQYFNAPFALHVAYWHERFGEPMSGGCINLSPRDGAWLFDFTDPKLPPDWNGVAGGGVNGPGTYVAIFR